MCWKRMSAAERARAKSVEENEGYLRASFLCLLEPILGGDGVE